MLFRSSCSGPLGAATLTPAPATYHVKANSTTNTAGQTDLNVGTFSIGVSTGECTFTISGGAPGSYDNNTHAMGMGPIPPIPPVHRVQLKVSNASGCGSVVTNGETMKFTATYTLTSTTLTGAALTGNALAKSKMTIVSKKSAQ